MHDANRRVRPRRADSVLVIHAQDGQRQRNRVKGRRLLVQVVVVLGLPAHLGRQLGRHVVGGELGRGLDAPLLVGEGGETDRVHPSLHDKGPEVEADDGADEARGGEAELDGCHDDY